MSIPPRAYRPGESLEDFCRVCKTDRMHTVVVVDSDGRPIRVDCGFCHSEHNYRGGPRIETSGATRQAPPKSVKNFSPARLRNSRAASAPSAAASARAPVRSVS